MTKQYAITSPDGSLLDVGSLGALEDAAAHAVGAGQGDVICIVGTKRKTCAEVHERALEKRAAWLERKEATHTKVSVRYGSSGGNFIKKWVRKECPATGA